MKQINNYKFMSIFNFKDNEAKKKFINFVFGDNGMKITRNYKGCLSINIYSSNKDTNKLVMIEEWNNMKSKKSYLEIRKKEGLYKYFETLLKNPVELELITPIEFNSKL